jgi:hypothetical protein
MLVLKKRHNPTPHLADYTPAAETQLWPFNAHGRYSKLTAHSPELDVHPTKIDAVQSVDRDDLI